MADVEHARTLLEKIRTIAHNNRDWGIRILAENAIHALADVLTEQEVSGSASISDDGYDSALSREFGQEITDKLLAFDEAWEKKSRSQYVCADCNDEVVTFLLEDEIWKQIAPPASPRSLLCIFCTENRLGRRLTLDDLKSCKHNVFLLWTFGARLPNRRPIDGSMWKFSGVSRSG
jgi:hypothetical protein